MVSQHDRDQLSDSRDNLILFVSLISSKQCQILRLWRSSFHPAETAYLKSNRSRPLTPVYQTRDYREGSAGTQGTSHQQSRTSKGTMRPRRRNKCGLQAKVYWCHRHRAACVHKQVLVHGTTAAARTCSEFRPTGTLSLHSWDQPDVSQHAARRYEPPADPHKRICFRSEVNLVTSTSDPQQPSQRGKRAAKTSHLTSAIFLNMKIRSWLPPLYGSE